MNLNTKLSDVKGVGEVSWRILRDAGLETVRDLIEFLPRKYEDFTTITKMSDLRPGKVSVRGKCEKVISKRFRNLVMTDAIIYDESGKIHAVWWNQAYRAKQIEHGDFLFSGNLELKRGRWQISNPSVEKVKEFSNENGKIIPIYPSRKGLKPATTRKILGELKELIRILPDHLPDEILSEQKLIPLGQALMQIHFPEKLENYESARQRLAFDELFELILAAKLNASENEKLKARKLKFSQEKMQKFVKNLPFTMTDAQKKSLWEILQDFEKDVPMNRLLQGDVGAGKTVVAAGAAFMATENNYQAAIMAPTAILATQHAESLRKILDPLGVSVELLVGGNGKVKNEQLAKIKDGNAQIIVGTHALFQDKVEFKNLGFVVIDEQHRFGVNQRNKLLQKVNNEQFLPHLLAMTATPIPRSLQLTVFGDLAISIINQLPNGRQPIETKIWRNSTRDDLYKFIKNELELGRQVYFVARLIEDSKTEGEKDQKSVQKLYKEITTKYRDKKVGILHGKMPAQEKEVVMTQFKNGNLDILCATTVIEVGVDVPNATVMVIENADRFGLAQLHQLRGRVGRGGNKSYCFVMPTDIEKITRRLKYIEESTDGFFLAEKDLELRGPGEVYGTAQHGDLNLQIASLGDTKLIARVSESVEYFMKNKTLEQYPELKRRVQREQQITTLN